MSLHIPIFWYHSQADPIWSWSVHLKTIQQKERVMLPGSVVDSNSEAKYILQGLLSRDPPANRQLFLNSFRFKKQLSKFNDSNSNQQL
jgi:hypothetical protein